MVNIWIIVGESNAGKSSSTRALTGIREQALYNIATTTGTLDDVLVIPSALQEFYIVQPADFIASISNNCFIKQQTGPTYLNGKPTGTIIENVLICLREKKIQRRQAWASCPDANAYISTLAAVSGWTIKPIIHLASPTSQYAPPVPHTILTISGGGVAPLPANEKARIIRNHWAWH